MGTAQTYQHDPDHIDYTPSGAVAVGDVVQVGDLFCVADRPIAAGKLGALCKEGGFILPKAAGAISQGTTVYWDATAGNIVTSAGQGGVNKRAGVAIEAAANGDATVKVSINYC